MVGYVNRLNKMFRNANVIFQDSGRKGPSVQMSWAILKWTRCAFWDAFLCCHNNNVNLHVQLCEFEIGNTINSYCKAQSNSDHFQDEDIKQLLEEN